MPTAYHHGVQVTEITEGVRPISVISTAIIGLVGHSLDADVDHFPLNKAVLVTDIRAALAKAGTQGTLYAALSAIYEQANAVCVVVRVATGVDGPTMTANVIGTFASGVATGMQALLTAEAQLKVKPRILGAPGLDNQAVASALISVAQKLRAFAYVEAFAVSPAEALTYRDQFSAREVMVIWPDFTAFDAGTGVGPGYASARALGLRAKIDQEQGWWKTLSNVPVQGVTGLSRDIYFDLQSSATDAGVLNAGQVTTLIHANGYRFWGSRTCSDEPLYAFESAVRTGQVLADTIAEGLMWAVDKPLHPSLAKDILASINARFRSLKAIGAIIDGRAFLNPDLNTTESLCNGELHIDYDYTPVPPLENLQLTQRITASYLADFAQRVASGS